MTREVQLAVVWVTGVQMGMDSVSIGVMRQVLKREASIIKTLHQAKTRTPNLIIMETRFQAIKMKNHMVVDLKPLMGCLRAMVVQVWTIQIYTQWDLELMHAGLAQSPPKIRISSIKANRHTWITDLVAHSTRLSELLKIRANTSMKALPNTSL